MFLITAYLCVPFYHLTKCHELLIATPKSSCFTYLVRGLGIHLSPKSWSFKVSAFKKLLWFVCHVSAANQRSKDQKKRYLICRNNLVIAQIACNLKWKRDRSHLLPIVSITISNRAKTTIILSAWWCHIHKDTINYGTRQDFL